MPKCSYCGKMYDIPYGLTFVLANGEIKHLCSSKCRKNMAMHRRRVQWVKRKYKESPVILENSKASANIKPSA